MRLGVATEALESVDKDSERREVWEVLSRAEEGEWLEVERLAAELWI